MRRVVECWDTVLGVQVDGEDLDFSRSNGSGGGPLENNVTAFLVRSLASGWAKGSVVAVDAGVHLSAIVKILEETQPAGLGQADGPSLPHILTAGPFAGLEVPKASAKANAAHIHKNLIDTYLITHPHLDHISGFVINTAGLPGARPKRLAGLPTTINAFKTHIFNNTIWPNLSDENNGAGLVTYMRLVEGGSPALGEGEGKGYLEICDGLSVKTWGVSHGHCIERHSHRGSSSSVRHGSFDASSVGMSGGQQSAFSPSRGTLAYHHSTPPNLGVYLQERMQCGQGGLLSGGASSRRGSGYSGGPPQDESVCVYDSSAYFIRDVTTGREILIFGDVEPDSVSLSPRNRQIWQEAGPKIAAGKLVAIFIECSYDDSQCVDRLFGHLTPRFIIEEMTVLAEEVVNARQATGQEEKPNSSGGEKKKRKRQGDDDDDGILTLPKRKSTPQPPPRETPKFDDHPISPKTVNPRRRVNSCSSTSDHDHDDHHRPSHTAADGSNPPPLPLPIYPSPFQLSSSTPPDPVAYYHHHHHEREEHDEDEDEDEDKYKDEELTSSPTTPPSTSITTASHTHTHPRPFASPLHGALKGLKVVIIHVKEKFDDGQPAGDVILEELVAHERDGARLGCEFVVSQAGEGFFL
ncbi:3',5'-cyclic-nucleotide phosphodiesterase [Madurella mycetomatis]|uniref:3',5'-cyclic-nucleotide phosphodiesterase n=1 Tax=Madurella mycetomatis TaxID=100816 RepID=A0A175VZT4_9PEZI|nr:3',5'-cyclic-nucleotide phosphodiesterase [Madurella mycetomatis]